MQYPKRKRERVVPREALLLLTTLSEAQCCRRTLTVVLQSGSQLSRSLGRHPPASLSLYKMICDVSVTGY